MLSWWLRWSMLSAAACTHFQVVSAVGSSSRNATRRQGCWQLRTARQLVFFLRDVGAVYA